MSTLLRASTELVGVSWLSGVTGLTAGMVATQLPRDNTTWAASGFVTVVTSGGSPGIYTPLRSPVVTVNTWAANPSSNKAPWGQANNLAELIDLGCRAANAQRVLTLPGSFPQARVLTAYLVTEPRRSYLDEGDYARYIFDLSLNWTAVPA